MRSDEELRELVKRSARPHVCAWAERYHEDVAALLGELDRLRAVERAARAYRPLVDRLIDNEWGDGELKATTPDEVALAGEALDAALGAGAGR